MTQGLARHFSRTKAHRDAMLKNLVTQLFQHGSIVSTHEKCQEASRLAERVITMAKKSDTQPRYLSEIQSRLMLAGDNRHLLQRVVREIAPRYQARPGGYTRILKLEPRLGDRAKQSVLELVDSPLFNSSGEFQRGNLKLWLLCKTVMANEAEGTQYSELTLTNLKKMLKFTDDVESFFTKHVLAVKKLIAEQEGVVWDKDRQLQLVKELKQQVVAQIPPKQADKGFVYVQQRPERN